MASDRFQRRIERLLDEADEAISQFDGEGHIPVQGGVVGQVDFLLTAFA